MDFGRPIGTVVPSLDGAVLQVLAGADRGLSGRQVHGLAGVGSVAGVRLVLQRLTSTGLVHVAEAGNSLLYTLNRKHLAAQAVELLSGLRTTFVTSLRAELATWTLPPVHAGLYGAAARGDGDLDSDVDVLLIRPDDVAADNDLWEQQAASLLRTVVDMTGNAAQFYELDLTELTVHVTGNEPIVDRWCDESVTVFGPDLTTVLSRLHTTRELLYSTSR
ncbi:nucleotidyltransferase domain-containing protein [Kribbella sp. NPDC051770]|uniref:nucleotidyltransferase domain-containing protein n=1 Tax=Kribbella sp. NPDC051770 TaxID=3155413 RepID=UPI00341D49D9